MDIGSSASFESPDSSGASPASATLSASGMPSALSASPDTDRHRTSDLPARRAAPAIPRSAHPRPSVLRTAGRIATVFSRAKTFLFLSAFVPLTGCVGDGYPEPPSDSAVSGYEYVIGEGDTLNIFVWGYPDLSVSVPVRPDGRITTRLVEDLKASGRTPTELAREIEARYVEYVNKPVVTISVDEFVGSAAQRVKVIGAGNEPRTVPYENGMSLLDLVIEVGGLGEFASGNRAVLVREEAGERRNFSLRLGDLVKKGDMSADILLRPGDIVIIPESWF